MARSITNGLGPSSVHPRSRRGPHRIGSGTRSRRRTIGGCQTPAAGVFTIPGSHEARVVATRADVPGNDDVAADVGNDGPVARAVVDRPDVLRNERRTTCDRYHGTVLFCARLASRSGLEEQS